MRNFLKMQRKYNFKISWIGNNWTYCDHKSLLNYILCSLLFSILFRKMLILDLTGVLLQILLSSPINALLSNQEYEKSAEYFKILRNRKKVRILKNLTCHYALWNGVNFVIHKEFFIFCQFHDNDPEIGTPEIQGEELSQLVSVRQSPNISWKALYATL